MKKICSHSLLDGMSNESTKKQASLAISETLLRECAWKSFRCPSTTVESRVVNLIEIEKEWSRKTWKEKLLQ